MLPAVRRGRPAYPDVLTPREWEVLALVKEGLTNPQIAQRLGITESGARFHVSEILSKLGVESRQEAAEWHAPRKPFAVGGLLVKWSASAAIAAAVIVLVLLGVGILAMKSRASSGADSVALPTPTEEPETSTAAQPATAFHLTGTRTGVSYVDAVVEAVEQNDESKLFSLIHYYPRACGPPPPATSGVSGVPCPLGEPVGTEVLGVFLGGCEGVFHPLGSEGASRAPAHFLTQIDARLYAIPRTMGQERGEFLVVFASGHVAAVDRQGVVAFYLPCSGPEGYGERRTSFLLAPR
jgi:DNA-binding CsgD family transcriptional regulator